MLYVDAEGQGWVLQSVGGRAVLVERFALTATPTMVVREWAAPGLKDYLPENGGSLAIHESRDGRLYMVGVFAPIYFTRPSGEPLSQHEHVIKAPRGKWRWSSCGRWLNTAKKS